MIGRGRGRGAARGLGKGAALRDHGGVLKDDSRTSRGKALPHGRIPKGSKSILLSE